MVSVLADVIRPVPGSLWEMVYLSSLVSDLKKVAPG
jgi:hypothetical protein